MFLLLMSAAGLPLCFGELFSLFFLTDLPWPMIWNWDIFPGSQTTACFKQDSLPIEMGILQEAQTWTLQGIRNY